MGERNLFLIGRRKGSEDQLTEMLAYLWEQEADLVPRWLASLGAFVVPAGTWRVATQVSVGEYGRFDMVLEVPDGAIIVVESKLGAALTREQLCRYVEYVGTRSEPV